MNDKESTPQEKALASATEFLKYSLALSTGTLVFGVGLVSGDLKVDGVPRVLLMASWILLALSVGLGVLAWSRIPVMVAKEIVDIEDKHFTQAGASHQVSFVLGILALGVAFSWATLTTEHPDPKEAQVCCVCETAQKGSD